MVNILNIWTYLKFGEMNHRKPSKKSRVDRTASVLQEVYKDYDAVRRSLDVPWIS